MFLNVIYTCVWAASGVNVVCVWEFRFFKLLFLNLCWYMLNFRASEVKTGFLSLLIFLNGRVFQSWVNFVCLGGAVRWAVPTRKWIWTRRDCCQIASAESDPSLSADLILVGVAPMLTHTLRHRPPRHPTSWKELKTPRTGLLLH